MALIKILLFTAIPYARHSTTHAIPYCFWSGSLLVNIGIIFGPGIICGPVQCRSGQNATLWQLLREQLEKPNRLNNRSAPSSLKRLFPLSIIIIQVAEESIFGVEQHFQARVRRFSLYEPTLNHWITHLLFSYLANWRTKAHKNVTVTVNRDSYRIIRTPSKAIKLEDSLPYPLVKNKTLVICDHGGQEE